MIFSSADCCSARAAVAATNISHGDQPSPDVLMFCLHHFSLSFERLHSEGWLTVSLRGLEAQSAGMERVLRVIDENPTESFEPPAPTYNGIPPVPEYADSPFNWDDLEPPEDELF